MNRMIEKVRRRKRRSLRCRRKVSGTPERPRLTVFRSLKHMYAQVIDDVNGVTLAAASTLSPDVRGGLKYAGNVAAAAVVGKAVAEKALAAGVKAVVFDKGPYKYHGRVKALADAAREAGLKF